MLNVLTRIDKIHILTCVCVALAVFRCLKVSNLENLCSLFNYDTHTSGYIPDIYRRLSKYGLTIVLYMYVRSGGFPSVVHWKTT